jgi:hypothetical protein
MKSKTILLTLLSVQSLCGSGDGADTPTSVVASLSSVVGRYDLTYLQSEPRQDTPCSPGTKVKYKKKIRFFSRRCSSLMGILRQKTAAEKRKANEHAFALLENVRLKEKLDQQRKRSRAGRDLIRNGRVALRVANQDLVDGYRDTLSLFMREVG